MRLLAPSPPIEGLRPIKCFSREERAGWDYVHFWLAVWWTGVPMVRV